MQLLHVGASIDALISIIMNYTLSCAEKTRTFISRLPEYSPAANDKAPLFEDIAALLASFMI